MKFYLKPVWTDVVAMNSVAAFDTQAASFNAVFASENTGCAEIQKLLILDDPEYFNPGRQRFGEGKIYLHEDLKAAGQVTLFNGSAAAIDVVRVEVLHEIDFRANYLVRRGEPLNVLVTFANGTSSVISENQGLDSFMANDFSAVQTTVGLYRTSQQPATHPRPTCP